MFNKPASYYVAITMACVWSAFSLGASVAQENDLSQKIWTSVGGKQNWESARYFMFTCQGPDDHDSQGRSASYLWDRQTGNCRFEGITPDNKELVVLFNLHDTTGQVFIDEVAQYTDDAHSAQIAQTLREFKKDAELLFLPTFQDGEKSSLSFMSEKLVGSSRQLVAQIKNDEAAYDAAVEGIIHVDAQNGQIRLWQSRDGNPRGISYEVSGYKDIGGGLILPTHFSSQQGNQRFVYPVAAALVHIETEKFTHP